MDVEGDRQNQASGCRAAFAVPWGEYGKANKNNRSAEFRLPTNIVVWTYTTNLPRLDVYKGMGNFARAARVVSPNGGTNGREVQSRPT